MNLEPAALEGASVAGGTLEVPVTPARKAQTTPRPKLRAADQIVEILIEAGVKTIFGLPGGPLFPLYDALLDRPEIRVVTCKHETMAVFAAAAYARATDNRGGGPGDQRPGRHQCAHRPGLGLLRQPARPAPRRRGPESSSAAARFRKAAPIRWMCAAWSSHHESGLRADQRPIGGFVDGQGHRHGAAPAARGRCSSRLPLDVTAQMSIPARIDAHVSAQFVVEAALLDEVADLLAHAERPLILAGSGARWGRGPGAAAAPRRARRDPGGHDPEGQGRIPGEPPAGVGHLWLGGHPVGDRLPRSRGRRAVRGRDGLRGGAHQHLDQIIKASKAFVQLDVDAGQIGKNYRVDVGLVGPAETLLRSCWSACPRRREAAAGPRHPAIHQSAGLAGEPTATIKPQRALWELQTSCRRTPSTRPTSAITRCLPCTTSDSIVPIVSTFAGGLGSMGSGIGAALGVKLGCPTARWSASAATAPSPCAAAKS